ncbi:MAG: T9SS type A sorting domain-containing protein [Bacteroidetes bacterium]|nr:T9SS type A sorting domain-containing protein [Bacteroidota bacterium]
MPHYVDNFNKYQYRDISSFSSGVYFVNLIDGGERVARKFVVSR